VNFAFGSAKDGAVTTTLLAVAAAWPAEREVVVLELDPAGGDIAVRYGLATEPGLVSLAAAARREPSPETLREHVQRLPGGLPVIVAPTSAEQAQAALRVLAERFEHVLRTDSGIDVLADCGRLGPVSPAEPVARGAAVTLLVARPTASEVAHLRGRVDALRSAHCQVGLLLIGGRPYGPDEVSAVLGVPVLGVLADDPNGARLLGGRASGPRALRRSPLMTSAADVAARVAAFPGRPSLPGRGPASSRRGKRAAGGATPSAVGSPSTGLQSVAPGDPS
jgi:hypothetical protein